MRSGIFFSARCVSFSAAALLAILMSACGQQVTQDDTAIPLVGGAPPLPSGTTASIEANANVACPTEEISARVQAATFAQQRAKLAIECDLLAIEQRIATTNLPPSEKSTLHSRVRELAKSTFDTIDATSLEHSRLPLMASHQKMFEVAAEAERLSSPPENGLNAWAADPWASLNPLAVPKENSSATLTAALMRGERRAVAFNLRSTREVAVRAHLNIFLDGFRGAMTIKQVNWTGESGGQWVAAELEPLGSGLNTLDLMLLPGITRQIWMEIQPSQYDLPGRYSGHVIASTGDDTVEIPLEVTVFQTNYPQERSMHLGGWDFSEGYDNYAIDHSNRHAFVEQLKSIGVDTPWAHAVVMHWDEMSESGTHRAQFDVTRLARWIREWPQAHRYRIHLHVDDYAGIPYTDPRFAISIATWCNTWAAEIRRLGKTPEQFDLLIMDEPYTMERARITERWAEAIRQCGVGFRIWTDPVWRDPNLIPPSLVAAVDTVAINLTLAEEAGTAYWDWARSLAATGKQIEVYASEGPARRLDPHAYYRLTSWKAFFLGASTVSFWSFADAGDGRSDHGFANGKPHYSPLFINGSEVRPSKQLYALLEGIQDAEYLNMIKQVANTSYSMNARQQGTELLDRARDLVTRRLLSKSRWESYSDANAADQLRKEMGVFLDSSLH